MKRKLRIRNPVCVCVGVCNKGREHAELCFCTEKIESVDGRHDDPICLPAKKNLPFLAIPTDF